MIIEAFFLCFNEEKMIEHTLNYYTKFCNKITVVDNQSTDNSVAIIKEKFPNVIVEKLDTGGKFIEISLTKVRNNIWKGSNADYVIVADMDEFLFDINLFDKLKEMKQQRIAIPKVVGYNMFSEIFPKDYKTPIFDQVDQKFRDKIYDKRIVFSPKWVQEMNYGPGSHFCNPEYVKDVSIKKEHCFELTLKHFKYLSREYLYEKHALNAKRSSNINKIYGHGYHYELGNEHIDSAFDKIKKNLEQNVKHSFSPFIV